MGNESITVKSLKKGAESLGLKPKKIKDVDGGIEYIKNFLEAEGAEIDSECPTCEKDIPDAVDICPYCGQQFDNKDGDVPDDTEEVPADDEGNKGTEEKPPEPEKSKKGEGKKEVAKKKQTDKKKSQPKAEVSGDGDKIREALIAHLGKQPLVKKEIAYLKEGASRISFWGPKGLIAKVFSAKGVCWMYLKDTEKKLVKLGASKLHVKKLKIAIKGLPTRYDLPGVGEVKNAVKALIGLAEEQEAEAEKEEKKAPEKSEDKKKAKKDDDKKIKK